jgi:soluble lytic murein transglycosylase-like protein
MVIPRLGAALLASGLLAAGAVLGIGFSGREGASSQASSATAATEAQVAAPAAVPGLPLPTDPALPRQADGRHYPLVPQDPAATARLLVAVEADLRNPATPAEQLPRLGHQQQVIYRVLSRDPERAAAVQAQLPEPWRGVAHHHLEARRQFLAMHGHHRRPTSLPAWRIIPPAPAEELLAHYRKAAAATGIDWEVLAAINLVESGMGRIDGVSVANAQGPMQFLPTTWAQAGVGAGNIRDPHDAIQAAARYLVRRGGLQDIRKGLWG